MSEQNRRFNFTLISATIRGQKILPQAISSLQIYEGIIYPGILGEMNISDWQGFNEDFEITAMDEVEFEFRTEDRPDLKLKFVIYASITTGLPTATYNPVLYKFCSKWLVDAFTRPISKNYKDKYIHEIVEDLLKECNANIGFVEPTKQKLSHFTSPLWTPLKTIHFLLSFAMNKQDSGGYVFWTDLVSGKTNLCTMDYLFAGKYGKEPSKFMSLPENDMYEGRIKNLSMENDFDVIKNTNQGLYKTTHQAYFIDKNKMYSYDESVETIPFTHNATHLPINAHFKDDKYKNIKGNYLYPIGEDLITNDNELKDMVDGKVKTRLIRLFSDIMKLNIEANPSAFRRAGWVCDVEFQSEDRSVVTLNQQYSGKYLIRNIRHMISFGTYVPILTLITDGYFKTKNSLVEWKK